ncbi:MAG: hypothetical protein AAB732_01340 [Patescibacteria group bacterium]
MTTKTITIQKKGTIVLPQKWLQKINQANKIKACFVNGNIILSGLENEQVCALFNQDLNKKIIRAKEKKHTKIFLTPKEQTNKNQIWFWTKEWQKKEKEAEKDIKSKRLIGPFQDVKKLIKDLKS